MVTLSIVSIIIIIIIIIIMLRNIATEYGEEIADEKRYKGIQLKGELK